MIITISGGTSSSDDFDVDPYITVSDLLSVFSDIGSKKSTSPISLALYKQVDGQAKEVMLDREKSLCDCGVMNGDILWLKMV